MSKGIIYVLTNPSMPDWIKVGITKRADVNKRIKELSRPTGVPLPFDFYYAKEVNDCKKKESAVFDAYGSLGLKAGSKEFIKKDCLDQVVKLIDSYDGEVVELKTNIDQETVKEIKEQEKKNKQRERFHFSIVGLNVGDEIKFTKDESITAKILDNKKNILSFRDKKIGFKDATSIVLNELGYNWKSFQPASYWRVGDEVNLHRMRIRLESE